MKLILVNIYPAVTMARYLISSYVLKAYVGAHLKKGALSIDVLNFSADTDETNICNTLIEHKPDYIGFSCYVWNIEKILSVLNKIKGELNAITILGGPEISLQRIKSFNDSSIADYFVLGEGEEKLHRLLEYLTSGNERPEVQGVAYWKGSSLHYSEKINSIANLDVIPSVYLSGAIESRFYARQQAFLETQRGCRFKCKYCVYHKNLSSYSFYSLERVFQELEFLIVEKKIRALRILDAIFTSEIKRAKEIIRYLIELKEVKGVKLPWIYWEFTYHNVDDDLLRLISRLKNKETISNCSEISPKNRPQMYTEMLENYIAINCIGIQSLNKESLKAVGRPPVKSDKIHEFMNMVNKYNIVLKVDMILGLPFETFESYFNGIEQFLPYFINTDHVFNIHILQILPGSDLENLCAQYGISYSLEAPHVINSTGTMSDKELITAAKLSAVLFRSVNSPLRMQFFDAKKRSGKSFYEFIRDTSDAITASAEFKETRFVQSAGIDDDYWSDDIFKEIPSEWLSDYFQKIPASFPESKLIMGTGTVRIPFDDK